MTSEPAESADRTRQADLARRFLDLHVPGDPLLLPNPWDVGSSRLFESLGFRALATTSSGFAASTGRLDGRVPRDEVLAHCATLVAATDVPISADLEHGFADDPDGVAETVRLAVATGLAGVSIEDHSGDPGRGMYPVGLAAERVAAAVEAAHAGPVHVVVTARADNGFHGIMDLADTIDRLQRFQDAGADVLYAPALPGIDAVRTVVSEVDLPVNVLAFHNLPPVAELAAAGVARVSIGGAFAYAAYGTAVAAASEFLLRGTYGFQESSGEGRNATLDVFDG